MSLTRRIVVLAGLIGLLHSSMVPPVQQIAGTVCRYHEFMLRHWPFTRGYGVNNANLAALLSEYGIILSVTAAAYLLLGLLERRRDPNS